MAEQPPPELVELARFSWSVPVLSAAANLRIADLLADGEKTVPSLAAASGAHAPSLTRLMRALQSLDICRAIGDRYVLTESGHFLRDGVPGSIRGPVMFAGGMLWKQFGDLLEVVKTGKPAPSVTSGSAGFDELARDPVRLHAFQLSMVASSTAAAKDAIKVHDFGRYRRILDLGGGYGGVLAALLQAYPGPTGEICDLAYLADGARAYLKAAGVGERAGFRGGDFFQSVPAGFDCYFLKFIVHDWDDAHASIILKNCAAAAGAGASVILLEQIVPDEITPNPAYRALIRSDLTMLTVGGKERTAAEYRDLLAESGLFLTAVTSTGAGFSLIEAAPRRFRS